MKELPQTVFVVDDDDAVRNSLRLLLKSAGIAAEAFASAQESNVIKVVSSFPRTGSAKNQTDSIVYGITTGPYTSGDAA